MMIFVYQFVKLGIFSIVFLFWDSGAVWWMTNIEGGRREVFFGSRPKWLKNMAIMSSGTKCGIEESRGGMAISNCAPVFFLEMNRWVGIQAYIFRICIEKKLELI